MVTKKSLSALKMAYISLGAVLIALCSWISVPATVPFTLQTFAVLLVCDLLGRVLFAPFELPVGVVLSLVGGCCFIILLFHRRGGKLHD